MNAVLIAAWLWAVGCAAVAVWRHREGRDNWWALAAIVFALVTLWAIADRIVSGESP